MLGEKTISNTVIPYILPPGFYKSDTYHDNWRYYAIALEAVVLKFNLVRVTV